MNKLKERWGITSNWDLVGILLGFSLNGSFAAWITKPLTGLFGVTSEVDGLLYWIIKIPLIFVVYHITLPLSGWVFGQFKFFWNMEKKILRRIGLKRFFPE